MRFPPEMTGTVKRRGRVAAAAAAAAAAGGGGAALKKEKADTSSTEWMWDLEGVLAKNRDIETRLSTTLHSVKLLRAEAGKEEELLAKEQAELEELERNAKAMDSRRKRAKPGSKMSSRHPLLDQLGYPDGPLAEADGEVGAAAAAAGPGEDALRGNDASSSSSAAVAASGHGSRALDLSVLASDQDMAPLLTQLRSHLESMQNNTKQLGSLVPTLVDTRADLELLTFQRLDTKSYRRLHGLEKQRRKRQE